MVPGTEGGTNRRLMHRLKTLCCLHALMCIGLLVAVRFTLNLNFMYEIFVRDFVPVDYRVLYKMI